MHNLKSVTRSKLAFVLVLSYGVTSILVVYRLRQIISLNEIPAPLPRPQLSWITSFWATDSTRNMHHAEIEAAILANMHNPHLDQIVVILDSVSNKTSNCALFVSQMYGLKEAFSLTHHRQFTDDCLPILTCVEREGGQPTYLEMFQYSLSAHVLGQIVILGNADHVFDETLYLARKLAPFSLLVLSSRGYNASNVPIFVRDVYHFHVVDQGLKKAEEEGNVPDRFSNPGSWDSYVYYARDLREIRPVLANNTASMLFARNSFDVGVQYYSMNELGAENCALHDLMASFRLVNHSMSYWNVCGKINSWHFHHAPKMHNKATTATKRWPATPGKPPGYERVPGPNVNSPPYCIEPQVDCPETFILSWSRNQYKAQPN